MENENALFETLNDALADMGAYKSAIIGTDKIVLDEAFRDMCAANACGSYGKCWMCPPDAGDIYELMAEIRKYDHALVYQTVSELEDSYDFEGMMRVKKHMCSLVQDIRRIFGELHISNALHLGAGGCGVCEVCAKKINEPCRYPALAIPSLEAYGINVLRLASAAGMKYINGENTVTYFGTVLFSTDKEKFENRANMSGM